MTYQFFISWLYFMAWCILESYHQTQGRLDFLLLPSGSFIVLHFKFSSEIYSELTFWLKCVKPLSRFFFSFLYVDSLLFQGRLWRDCLYFTVFPLPLHQRAGDCIRVGLLLGSVFLFHRSTCLLFTKIHTVLISEAL